MTAGVEGSVDPEEAARDNRRDRRPGVFGDGVPVPAVDQGVRGEDKVGSMSRSAHALLGNSQDVALRVRARREAREAREVQRLVVVVRLVDDEPRRINQIAEQRRSLNGSFSILASAKKAMGKPS